jgi:transposase
MIPQDTSGNPDQVAVLYFRLEDQVPENHSCDSLIVTVVS